MKQLKFLTSAFIAVVLLGCSVFPAFAQQTSGDHPTAQAAFDPHYYHLVFVVKEVEAGSVINSRSYFMTIGTVDGSANTHNARSIRTGSRIPAE